MASSRRTTKKKPNARTKRKDRLSTEQRLLDAGLQVFSQQGYDAATTRMVSEVSGVNESLIIRYFGSKKGLLTAIILRNIREYACFESDHPAEDSLEKELIASAKSKFLRCAFGADFFRLVVSQALIDADMRRTIREEKAKKIDLRFSARVNELIEKGKLKTAIDPAQIKCVLDVLVVGVTTNVHLMMDRSQEETFELLSHIIECYAAGLSQNRRHVEWAKPASVDEIGIKPKGNRSSVSSTSAADRETCGSSAFPKAELTSAPRQ